MYSRDFSDRHPLPPEYGGTALVRERRAPPPPSEEGAHCPPPREEDEEEACPTACPPPPPPREEGGGLFPLFGKLLPAGIDSRDLLLLGLAVLLLLDGCEDEVLPLLLLFLLIVH